MPFDDAAVRAAVLATLRGEPRPTLTQPAATAPHPEHIGPWPYVVAIGGQGADLASTLIARQRPGVEEVNPIYGDNTAAIIAGKAGTAALLSWAMHELAKSGHPTAAKWLGYGSGAAVGALAGHNLTVGR